MVGGGEAVASVEGQAVTPTTQMFDVETGPRFMLLVRKRRKGRKGPKGPKDGKLEGVRWVRGADLFGGPDAFAVEAGFDDLVVHACDLRVGLLGE